MWTAQLKSILWPVFEDATAPPPPAAGELQRRIEALRAAMTGAGLSCLAVYGDREHFANLLWLTGFDPRFEEALLLVGTQGAPLLLVGNECEAYLKISASWREGALRHELFQPLSLPDQPRGRSRTLDEILAAESMSGAIGCAGWKLYARPEQIDAPAYLVDALRMRGTVTNAAGLFTRLRAHAGANELAWMEYSNVEASEAMRRLLLGIQEGLTDHDLVRTAGYNGLPMACHWTVKTGPRRVSLASASGNVVERGNFLSANLSYWGSNCCRCAWVAADAAEAPKGYASEFAGPYMAAMAAWLSQLNIGRTGGELAALISELLPYERFGITLNPGHLIHFDEWPGSPIYAGSTERLHSGMVLQSDIIPSSPRWSSTRMEDSYALAGAELRQVLREEYPAMFRRCRQRREFLTETLGFVLPEEVLPLSNLAGIAPPYLLSPDLLFTVKQQTSAPRGN